MRQHLYRIMVIGAITIVDLTFAGHAQAAQSASCLQTQPARLKVGIYAQVSPLQPPSPLKVHADNNVKSATLVSLPLETHFTVLKGPVFGFDPTAADSQGPYTWYLIRTDGGVTGWVAEGDEKAYFTKPLPDSITPPDPPMFSAVDITLDIQPVYSIAWSPSGKSILVFANQESKIWLPAGTLKQDLMGTTASRWLPDGKLLYIPLPGGDSLQLVDEQGKRDSTLVDKFSPTTDRPLLYSSPNGKTIELVDQDAGIRLYNRQGKSLAEITNVARGRMQLYELSSPMSWSPDSQWMVGFSFDAPNDEPLIARLWDANGIP